MGIEGKRVAILAENLYQEMELWMLCSADVLAGRTVTSFPSIKDDMIHAGARWVDQEVVVDGHLITSRRPDDLPAFCRELTRALSKTSI
jgi:protease I